MLYGVRMPANSAAFAERKNVDAQKQQLDDKIPPKLVTLKAAQLSLIKNVVNDDDGWADRIKKRLSEEQTLEGFLTQSSGLISDTADLIEHRRYEQEGRLAAGKTVTDEQRSNDYYKQPIWSALKHENAAPGSPLQSAHLQALFEYGTDANASDEALFVPENREDVDRLGSELELRARLFWAEVHSIHERQRGWTTAERYRALVAQQPDAQRVWLGHLQASRGHLIHGLVARDSNKRWAYYHVFVPGDREGAFLKALDGKGNIDLEDYGRVILSTYEKQFRDAQTTQAHEKFKEIIRRYEALAVRQKEYSYASPPSGRALGPFDLRRFQQALDDEGSRDALLRDLAEKTESLGPIQPPEGTEVVPAPLRFTHALSDGAAGATVALVRDRHLGISDVAFIARLLIDRDDATLKEFIEPLVTLARYVGTSDEQYARFLYFICQNRSLTHPGLVSAALTLASEQKKPAWWKSGLVRSLLPLAGAAPLLALGATAYLGWKAVQGNLADEISPLGMEWRVAQRSLAVCDFLLRSDEALGARFAERLFNVISRKQQDLGALRDAIGDIAKHVLVEKSTIHIGRNAIEAASLTIEQNTTGRIIDVEIANANEDYAKLLRKITESSIIDDIKSLSVLWHYLRQRPEIEQREFLQGVLENSLSDVFDRAELSPEDRELLVAKIVDGLLTDRVETVPRWADRADKSRGQDPTPFLREHYAAELTREAGMSIGELGARDEALAKSVMRWVTKYGLPIDLNLDMRTREQRNDDTLQEIERAKITGRLPTFTEREEKRIREAGRRRAR